jgi:hypothetical protein
VGGVCSGGLDFLYQISDTSATDGISNLGLNGFTGFTTNVNYGTTVAAPFSAINGTNPAPSSANRTLAGATVNFVFSPVEYNVYSDILDISTNATTYSAATGSIIDGASQNLSGLLAPTPEPLWSGLFLSGILGAGLFFARRHRTA